MITFITRELARRMACLASLLLFAAGLSAQVWTTTRPGYYRYAAIHGDTIIFTA